MKEGALQGCTSAHSIAEFYSVMTRAPFNPRIHLAEAAQLLENNIFLHFDLLAHPIDDYKDVLTTSTTLGLIAGVIFDALHLRAAQRAPSC